MSNSNSLLFGEAASLISLAVTAIAARGANQVPLQAR